jgi:hypothetical protein
VASGSIIAESLRLGAALEGFPLEVVKIARVGPLTGVTAAQPEVWTFVDFVIDDARSSELADLLAGLLAVDGGWYCDFRTNDETFVVFAERIFRYPRGDHAGRQHAAEHARSVGIPESQIDWPE